MRAALTLLASLAALTARSALAAPLLSSTSTSTSTSSHQLAARQQSTANAAGYLSATFLGYDPRVFFHAADAGSETSFTALNGGQAVLTPTQGTKGVRDPAIVQSADGSKFYVIGVSRRAEESGCNHLGFDADMSSRTWISRPT